MTKLKYISGIILAAVLSVVVYTGTLHAQSTGTGFVVSPVLDNTITLQPGETTTRVMTVKNPTTTAITVKLVANDFEPSDNESGVPRFDFDGTNSINYANKFASLVSDIDDVKLEPGKDTPITITFTAPSDANPGGYYGAIRVEPIAVPGDKQLNLAASVGTLYLVTVPGDLVQKMELVEFTAAKNNSAGRFFIGNGSDLQVITRLKNTGNIHTQPFGKIVLTDSKGNTVETIDFNTADQKENVLPESIRRFVNDIQKDNLFGKYTITTNISFGSGGDLITAKNTFWVIPVWMFVLAIVLLVAIIVGAFLIYVKVSKSRKHKVKPRR